MTTSSPATYTFLFTDIEGSSRQWEEKAGAMSSALAAHDRRLRDAVESHRGRVVKMTGDGCHAVFATAADGLAAALAAQQAPGPTPEFSEVLIRIRMGLHSGEAEPRDGDYFGPAVNRAARIMSIGHGGQVLLSAATVSLLDGRLPPAAGLRDLGEHRLKDLSRPERIFQLVAPGLPADFPPLRSLDAYPGNLPVQLTGFIGRERELAEVKRLLVGTRLLTLTGPGGTGKTRLSLQTAGDVQAGFAHGAWLVELAPLADPANVPATVAAVFDLAPQPGAPPEAVLLDYLRGKHLLLILDNCEHLVEASARLAAGLLPACPRLTILASSREGLGVAGETTYHVPTLAVPNPDETTAAAVCRADAADLFLQRARAARPDFAVTDANAAAVAQIVRRLDGIPLAIELAAARVRSLSPEQIAARLDDRFRLLTGGSRTALPRQQTLRALIDWSYTLLSPDEATLFRRLGVFVGGWTLEAAEEVASDDGDSGRPTNDESRIERVDVLDLLDGLVNKSLVMADEEAGSTRYRFLETIRQYARDKLFESGEGEAVRDRHGGYYNRAILAPLELVRMDGAVGYLSMTASIHVAGRVSRLESDVENVRAATDWITTRDPEQGLLMATTLALALTATRAGDATPAVRDALAAVDSLAADENGAAARRRELRTLAFLALANHAISMGDAAAARDLYSEVADLARQNHNKHLLARALVQRSLAEGFLNDDAAFADADNAVTLFRELGEPLGIAQALGQSAIIFLRRGDLARAGPLADQAGAVLMESVDPLASVLGYLSTPLLARASGDVATAEKLYREGQVAFQRMGNRGFAAIMQSDLAHMLRQEGRIDEARPIYLHAIREWQDLGRRASVANMLESFAFVARADGQPVRAARLLGAAEALRDRIHVDMTPWEREEYDRDLAALRETLPADVLAAEWAAGRKLDMDAAVDYAVTG